MQATKQIMKKNTRNLILMSILGLDSNDIFSSRYLMSSIAVEVLCEEMDELLLELDVIEDMDWC